MARAEVLLIAQVFISFAQTAVARQGSEEKNMWNWLNPKEGGSSMAYAWDEPAREHKMRVQVQTFGFPASLQAFWIGGSQPPVLLPCVSERNSPSRPKSCGITLSADACALTRRRM